MPIGSILSARTYSCMSGRLCVSVGSRATFSPTKAVCHGTLRSSSVFGKSARRNRFAGLASESQVHSQHEACEPERWLSRTRRQLSRHPRQSLICSSLRNLKYSDWCVRCQRATHRDAGILCGTSTHGDWCVCAEPAAIEREKEEK